MVNVIADSMLTSSDEPSALRRVAGIRNIVVFL